MDASLSGEPQNALLIERRGIEIGVAELPGQREQFYLAGLRIEATENAFLLAAVPYRAVRRRRHVMRIVARRQLIEGRLRGEARCCERARKRRNHGGDESHPRLPRQIAVLLPPAYPGTGRPPSQGRVRALSRLEPHQAKTLRRCFPRCRATKSVSADKSSPASPGRARPRKAGLRRPSGGDLHCR